MLSDINLDGKFDEKDHVKPYDLNFGAPTSFASFSSGNFLPVILKNQSVAIPGERSGGGVCNMIQAATADGLLITTSGYTKMIVGYGEAGYDEMTVEYGAAPDMDLVPKTPEGASDYSNIYNLDMISEGMNKFFASA